MGLLRRYAHTDPVSAKQSKKALTAWALAARVIAMSAACCGPNADATCRDGSPPRECNAECAVYYHSFFADCGMLVNAVMVTQIDAFAAFDETCLASADVGFFLDAIQHATCASPRREPLFAVAKARWSILGVTCCFSINRLLARQLRWLFGRGCLCRSARRG